MGSLFCLVLAYGKQKKKEKYEEDPDEYDYDRENPNALVTGYNVAGTVFATDPDKTPGLGWVL